MTFNALYKRIAKMTPAQRKCKVRLYEGCSGSWDTLDSIVIPKTDEYREGDEPERFKEFEESGPDPVVLKGQPYGIHDH